MKLICDAEISVNDLSSKLRCIKRNCLFNDLIFFKILGIISDLLPRAVNLGQTLLNKGNFCLKSVGNSDRPAFESVKDEGSRKKASTEPQYMEEQLT